MFQLVMDDRYILRYHPLYIYPPDILGTRKGVKALTVFKSNAYTRPGTRPPTRQKPFIDDKLPESYSDAGPDDKVHLAPLTHR